MRTSLRLALSSLLLPCLCSCLDKAPQTSPAAPSPMLQAPASPQPSLEPSLAPSPVESEAPEASFDPASITAEMKQETLISVADLILELNRITREKNFDAWQSYLTPEFRVKYSSPSYLAEISEKFVVLRIQKIVLKTLKDYFYYVVYPSHQNDRVDDIDYIGHNRVKAIYYNEKQEKRVLWDLEKMDGTWKIGIGIGIGI
jgi:hypothetical protein